MFDRFPDNMMEMKEALNGICWRTYNFKLEHEAETDHIVPVDEDERTLFRQVVCNGQEHGVIVVEHVGGKQAVMPGTFLGRVVAVARDRCMLEDDIRLGIEQLNDSIRKHSQTQESQEDGQK